MRPLLALMFAASLVSGATLVDRIAVITGRQIIKTSDIDRDLRVTAFLNRQPPDLGSTARRKSAQRLVDQQIVREEMSSQGYARASQSDADTLLNQIVRDRFHGSEPQLRTALAAAGLTRDVLREQLLWQITVLSFIDQRFRSGILVTDEEVRAYYDQHLNDLKRQYPKDYRFETLSPQIHDSLEGDKIDKDYESWLDEARKRRRIEYKEPAFQ